MDREELSKKNREENNKFLLKLNELRGFNEVGSIKTLAYNKIMSFIDYCESRDVYYFSELPISDRINDAIFNIVNDSIEYDKEAVSLIKEIENRKGISILANLVTRLKLNGIRNDYFELYSVLSECTFKSVYSKGYKEHYDELIKNVSDEELSVILDNDRKISVKLNMEEEFKEIESRVRDCKINVYKIK